MKTHLFPFWLALVLVAQGGCMIPLDRKLHSERELGRRDDPASPSTPVVLRRVVRQRILSPLSENGFGKDYIDWNQYYLRRGEEETRLRFLEIGMIDGSTSAARDPRNPMREIEPDVRPIHGTTSWIAVRMRKVERTCLDVEIIVFDEALQHREIAIEQIQRRVWRTRTFIEKLEYADGNRRVIFHKDEGRFALDLLTFEIKQL